LTRLAAKPRQLSAVARDRDVFDRLLLLRVVAADDHAVPQIAKRDGGMPEFGRANRRLGNLPGARLESPNGLTPARSLSQGIPAVQVPAVGNGILDIPSDYAFNGYPKKLDRGYIQSWNVTVQRELPWSFSGQVGYVATRSVRQLGILERQFRIGVRVVF
jgi:hypothetical protein